MYLLFLITLLSLQKVQGSIEESMMDLPDISTANWTTCEEFLNGTRFEVDSVIDVDWVIFYYWTTHAETSYHIRFSAPTPMLVDRFRLELNNYMTPKVNWSQADLFLETSVDLSGLFIRTNVSGQFRFIPSLSFQYHYAPWLVFALKVVDGYLGMMNCKQQFAYALAPVENMPNPLKIEELAKIFGIQNPVGKSYLTKNSYEPPNSLMPIAESDDGSNEQWHSPALSMNMLF